MDRIGRTGWNKSRPPLEEWRFGAGLVLALQLALMKA